MLASYYPRAMAPEIGPEIRAPLSFMHGHLSGLLQFDENVVPIKVVVEREGRLVAPVMVAMLTAGETVLYLPDEEKESMHLTVTLEEFKETGPDGELADRWRIYHGEPEDLRWAVMHIEAARLNGVFYDGDGLLIPNALGSVEAAICRWANENVIDGLRAACFEQCDLELNDPKLVGVDQLGFDVRGRFEVVRLQPQTIIESEEQAYDVLRNLTSI